VQNDPGHIARAVQGVDQDGGRYLTATGTIANERKTDITRGHSEL